LHNRLKKAFKYQYLIPIIVHYVCLLSQDITKTQRTGATGPGREMSLPIAMSAKLVQDYGPSLSRRSHARSILLYPHNFLSSHRRLPQNFFEFGRVSTRNSTHDVVTVPIKKDRNVEKTRTLTERRQGQGTWCCRQRTRDRHPRR